MGQSPCTGGGDEIARMVCVLPAVPQLLALEVLPLGGVLAGPQALRPNRQRHKREHVLRTNLGRDFGFQVVLT